jgi:MFS superfamily sulfate permease-like transporter
MVGLGAANLAAGLFLGFPVSSSSSRTPVAEAAGSRTQLTGVVGALLVALLLLTAPDLLKHVPTAALPAVVISSAIGPPLFFANAEFFKDRALAAAAAAPSPVEWLVVAAEPVTSIDVTATDGLSELNETLRRAGAKPCFAELKDPVKDKLKRFGLFDQIGGQFFFATAGEAVDEYERPQER